MKNTFCYVKCTDQMLSKQDFHNGDLHAGKWLMIS